MRICTCSTFTEQRAVIRFLTRKGLRASAIAAELKPVYETEARALSTMKKWRKRFAEERTSPYKDARCGRPLTNDLAEVISSVGRRRNTFHARFSVSASHCRGDSLANSL
jgi:transposase